MFYLRGHSCDSFFFSPPSNVTQFEKMIRLCFWQLSLPILAYEPTSINIFASCRLKEGLDDVFYVGKEGGNPVVR